MIFLKYNLLPHEDTAVTRAYYKELWDKGFRYPGVHSFRAGRMGSKEAYQNAGISDPLHEIDFVELHDAYTSSEIQTYEDMGPLPLRRGRPLCRQRQSVHARHQLRPGFAPMNRSAPSIPAVA